MKTIWTTGICRKGALTEYTVLRVRSDGCEIETQGEGDSLGSISDRLRGSIVTTVPSTDLLMQTLELPDAPPEELQAMAALQADKLSPFPAGSFDHSFEILHCADGICTVLLVIAPKSHVDAVGETYRAAGTLVHSLDASILCRWHQLEQTGNLPEGNAVLFLEDIDSTDLILLKNGKPVLFRTLGITLDLPASEICGELKEELEYSLTALETASTTLHPERLVFWMDAEPAPELRAELSAAFGHSPEFQQLDMLPPLSEALARRALMRSEEHIELIPEEWITARRRREMLRKLAIGIGSMAGVWLLLVILFFIALGIRQSGLNRMRNKEAGLARPAQQVEQNRRRTLTLESHFEQSRSALEALREISSLLPQEVDLTGFTYKKESGVNLRGQSSSDRQIYAFFSALGQSELFTEMENERVGTNPRGGNRRSTFSISANFEAEAEQEEMP